MSRTPTRMSIAGTSAALERSHTRSAADREWDPAELRPPAVLREALRHVLSRRGSFPSLDDERAWMQDQLRGLRQDERYDRGSQARGFPRNKAGDCRWFS